MSVFILRCINNRAWGIKRSLQTQSFGPGVGRPGAFQADQGWTGRDQCESAGTPIFLGIAIYSCEIRKELYI